MDKAWVNILGHWNEQGGLGQDSESKQETKKQN